MDLLPCDLMIPLLLTLLNIIQVSTLQIGFLYRVLLLLGLRDVSFSQILVVIEPTTLVAPFIGGRST